MHSNIAAMMTLHAIGDIIGSKNNPKAFAMTQTQNDDLPDGAVIEHINTFFTLGGINGLPIKTWQYTANTLFHLATANTLIKHPNTDSIEDLITTYKNNMIDVNNALVRGRQKGTERIYDSLLIKYILKFEESTDARSLEYNYATGTNGPAARLMCIGCMGYPVEKLTKIACTLGLITNNAPYGYLSGLTAAFFVSLALQKIDVAKWPAMLIDLLKQKHVKQFVQENNDDVGIEYASYINYWEHYIETRFDKDQPLTSKSFNHIAFRIEYIYHNFVYRTYVNGIGVSGFCATIMAYDGLLSCDGKWEKLVLYTMLHQGDSAGVGAIAGGLYGIVYGMGDVPQYLAEQMEQAENIQSIGQQLEKLNNAN